jgi:hypothetical protein
MRAGEAGSVELAAVELDPFGGGAGEVGAVERDASRR